MDRRQIARAIVNRPPALPDWWEGTVDSITPLRVKVRGHVPDSTPDTLVAGLQVGHAVWGATVGGRAVILGRFGGTPIETLVGAKLVKTANQTYNADTWTKITFSVAEYSDASGFADVANSRLVIPETGRYMVGAALAHPTQFGFAHIRQAVIVNGDTAPVNGNQIVRSSAGNNADSSRSPWHTSLAAPVALTVGDYLTLWYRSSATSNFGVPDGEPFHIWAQKVK